jgi:flagellar biosynthesis/type III secretory pathway protein FliH
MPASPVKFIFDDFHAPPPAQATLGEDNGASALETARAEGFAAGLKSAQTLQHVERDAALARIAASIAEAAERRDANLAADRADILAAARAFLETFCTHIAASRDVEAACDLLSKIHDFPRGARLKLFVGPSTSADDRSAIAARAAAISDAPPVAVLVDETLLPGEARLEWTDGAFRRTRAEIESAVNRLVDSLAQHLKENAHDSA